MDKISDPKSITTCFHSNLLQGIVAKARQLAALDKALFEVLPKEMAPHCRVMNVTEQSLIVETDSATWATRLRLESETVIRQLAHRQFNFIKRIECRVRPAFNPDTARHY